MSKINYIIFDLGGVILNLNYQLTIDAFKQLGIPDFDEFFTQQKQNNFFDDFEIGKVSALKFRSFIKQKIKISDLQIDQAWNAMLLDLPVSRIEMIERLKVNYKVFLLSNTNEIHISAFKKIIDSTIGYQRFLKAFDKCYFSSEIGLRKPNLNCFNHVITENNLVLSETLFIDDSIQHINGAKKANLNTHLLLANENITQILPGIIQ